LDSIIGIHTVPFDQHTATALGVVAEFVSVTK
jgi:hypothetical protein